MSTFAAFFTMGTVCLLLIALGVGIAMGLLWAHRIIFGERRDGL